MEVTDRQLKRLVLLRQLSQLTIVVVAIGAGIGSLLGWCRPVVEKYCPFGGLETALSLLTRQQFSCATGALNLSLVLALFVLTFLSRKSFCSWICPIGTVSEWLSKLLGRGVSRGKLSKHRRLGLYDPPKSIDRATRFLRLPILVAILVLTFTSGELIFRPYDPYYVLFGFSSHDVQLWSYPLVAGIMVFSAIIPMAWCRYLCPLGVALWPWSAVGRLRLKRNEKDCTKCKACDVACPHSIPISPAIEVRSGECTMCLDCMNKCPTSGALRIVGSAGGTKPLSGWLIPALIVCIAGAGIWGAGFIDIPSVTRTYSGSSSNTTSTRETVFVVDGVRCVDTARVAAKQLDATSGAIELTAYAASGRLDIVFDPSVTDVAKLKHAIEGPGYDEKEERYVFHRYKVIEIDGSPVLRK